VVHLSEPEQAAFREQVLRLEREGRVTRTYRRLDQERQLAVVVALLEDAAEHGPTAIGVKRVAARAGVAVGSLYQYFPGRDGMLAFAAELASRLLAGSLAGYRDALASLPLREGLRAYLAGGIEWSRERVGLLRFLARAAYQGDPAFGESLVRPLAQAMRDLVRAMVEAAGERGELREGLDADAAVRAVHALSIPLGDAQLLPHLNDYFLLFDDDHPPARVGEALIDLLAYALTGAAEKGARHGKRSPRRRGARQAVR